MIFKPTPNPPQRGRGGLRPLGEEGGGPGGPGAYIKGINRMEAQEGLEDSRINTTSFSNVLLDALNSK